jgi:chaperonin cofactor prefoldin
VENIQMSITGVQGNMTVQQVTGGLDLEAFMMSVSAGRANNLEAQMAGQIDSIKQRQTEIKELNQLLAEIQALRPSGNDPEAWADLGTTPAESEAMVSRLEKAGVTIVRDGSDGEFGGVNKPGTGNYDAKQVWFDKWVNEIKGSLDNLNSTSQMDMIRLQSLSNKRNQAFEMLTNQIQKFAKTNDGIIGNMR